jgi:hypothetical protein
MLLDRLPPTPLEPDPAYRHPSRPDGADPYVELEQLLKALVRQRTSTEQRGDQLFVQITISFRVTVPDDEKYGELKN